MSLLDGHSNRMELNSNHSHNDLETVGVDDFATIAAAEGVVDFRIDFLRDRTHAAVAQRELSESDVGSREPFVIAIELVWTKLSFEQHHVTILTTLSNANWETPNEPFFVRFKLDDHQTLTPDGITPVAMLHRRSPPR